MAMLMSFRCVTNHTRAGVLGPAHRIGRITSTLGTAQQRATLYMCGANTAPRSAQQAAGSQHERRAAGGTTMSHMGV
jgi:hypothetical protein